MGIVILIIDVVSLNFLKIEWWLLVGLLLLLVVKY